MIPELYALDLDHQINVKIKIKEFLFFDRYRFLNLNFDR